MVCFSQRLHMSPRAVNEKPVQNIHLLYRQGG
nr:MAG TPA: hypothetical protein [Caudoviricetes sp.]